MRRFTARKLPNAIGIKTTSVAITRIAGSERSGIILVQVTWLFQSNVKVTSGGLASYCINNIYSSFWILREYIYYSKSFYGQVKQILTAVFAVILLTISADTQSTSSSFRQACSMTVAGQPTIRIICRWMSDADTGNTIFVDNTSTGETYELNGIFPEWRTDPKSINSKPCIINKFKTSVCQLWFRLSLFRFYLWACFNLDIYNVSIGNCLKKG